MKSLTLFVRQSTKNFIKIGAFFPSSSRLAKRIAKNIKARVVLELGPGTGIFTKEILKKLPSDGRLICIENNSFFVEHLQEEIKDARLELVAGDALALRDILKSHGINKVDCIVSGLPIGNFTKNNKSKILTEISDCLNDDGLFIQFEYFLAGIKSVKEFFSKIDISYEIFNIPPAFVMECKK